MRGGAGGWGQGKGKQTVTAAWKVLKNRQDGGRAQRDLHNGILGVAVTSSYLSPDLFHLEKPLIVTQRTVPALRALSG